MATHTDTEQRARQSSEKSRNLIEIELSRKQIRCPKPKIPHSREQSCILSSLSSLRVLSKYTTAGVGVGGAVPVLCTLPGI